MKQHINLFNTIEEAITTLKSLGVDPLKTPESLESPVGATYPFPWGHLCQPAKGSNEDQDEAPWQEGVISIHARSEYVNSEERPLCDIHMVDEGFDALLKILEGDHPVSVELFSKEYDMHSIRLGDSLRIFKLVERKEAQS